jgi:pimeloyl-ACP methyl ester carboxylesterase
VLAECERQVLAQPTVHESFRLELGEAFRQGLDGWGWDSWLLARPWGFRLEDIAVPAYVWHGEQDSLVPPAAGHYLAQAIPNCRAVFFPEEEHWIAPHYWAAILPTLVGGLNAAEGPDNFRPTRHATERCSTIERSTP